MKPGRFTADCRSNAPRLQPWKGLVGVAPGFNLGWLPCISSATCNKRADLEIYSGLRENGAVLSNSSVRNREHVVTLGESDGNAGSVAENAQASDSNHKIDMFINNS